MGVIGLRVSLVISYLQEGIQLICAFLHVTTFPPLVLVTWQMWVIVILDRGCVGSHRWERVIDDPDCIGYHYTRCIWAEVYRDLGEPELGFVICAGDEPAIRSYNPRLAFKRTKVLMNGDEMCDHVFYVKTG
jgi:hypothetical protein